MASHNKDITPASQRDSSTGAAAPPKLTPREYLDILQYRDMLVRDDQDRFVRFLIEKNERLSQEASKRDSWSLNLFYRSRSLETMCEARLQDIRSLQNTISDLKENIKVLEDDLRDNSFVAVLIDGEKYFSQHKLLHDGTKGGYDAASTLNCQIAKWANSHLHQPEIKIIGRVFADFANLAETCVQSRLVESHSQIKDFVDGFNDCHPLFDTIELGSVSNMREKLKASFQLFLKDHHCRHIILGWFDDESVSNLLGEDNENVERVSLVGDEGSTNKLKITSYKEPLKREKACQRSVDPNKMEEGLVKEKGDGTNAPDAKSISSSVQPKSNVVFPKIAISRGSSPAMPINSSLIEPAVGRSLEPKSKGPANFPPGQQAAAPHNWAAVLKIGLPHSQTNKTSTGTGTSTSTSITPTTTSSKNEDNPITASADIWPVVLINRYAQRIDELVLTQGSPSTYNEFKQMGFCFHHYLTNDCKATGSIGRCNFNHNMEVTKVNLDLLRLSAREIPCGDETKCRYRDCIYGHHCQFQDIGSGSKKERVCPKGDKCSFSRTLHEIDTHPARVTN